MEDLEYITKDALIMCDKGGAPDFFRPTLNQTVKIHGCLVATQIDFAPLINIPSFKICTITQKPCMPLTTPWQETWPVKVWHQRTLLGQSYSQCALGGRVEFMTSGQIPLPDDAMAEVRALQEQCNKELNDAGYGDSVGECGFWEGMIPVWGSGKDMINDFQTGDYWWCAYNAFFCAWDVCSVVAGVVSFGAGTAAMQAGKLSLKQAVTSVVRAFTREGLEQIGKQAFKRLTKEALKDSMCRLMAKLTLNVVTACFTGDTLIHIKDGLKQIKDIKIGDEVFSYNKNHICLNKVTHTIKSETSILVEVICENEIIKVTPNHPFYIDKHWVNAEDLRIGDSLLTKNMTYTIIESLNFIGCEEKVYNFEVENDHCYFVGIKGFLVHNVCPELIKKLIQSIPDALKKNLKCVEFADEFRKILKLNGINGEQVVLKSERFITDATGKVISENGYHIGTKIDNIIYDNLNPNGIPYDKWLDDLGAGFPGMSGPFVTPL